MYEIDLTRLPVAPGPDWRIEFGLYLRGTPTQKNRERSFLTLEAYERDLSLMAAWFEKLNKTAFEPGQLNAMDLKAYFKMLEDSCQPSTYNRKLASVRMLIKWSRLNNILDYDPAEWIPFIDATRKSPRDLNDAERVRLEEVALAGEETLIGLRDSLMFFLMSDAGLRIDETVKLQLTDLHLDQGYIHVLGKGRKHREVKIGAKLINKIRTWLNRKPDSIEGTLITDDAGLSIKRGQAWRRFVLIRNAAGVMATPHAMRHTYVMRFMDAYMSGDPFKLPAAIDAVCQQTGDKPEVILAYYTRARESDMRAAAELL
jgi:site-specific recombinase XerD